MIHDPCELCLVRPICRRYCNFKLRCEESKYNEWKWGAEKRFHRKLAAVIGLGILAILLEIIGFYIKR